MYAEHSLAIFTDNLFPGYCGQIRVDEPQIVALGQDANRDLKAEAGRAYDVLSPRAEMELQGALSRLLLRLLLFNAHYEVLQRAARSWVDAQRDFLIRLNLDHEQLQRAFEGADPKCRLEHLEIDLSDRHNGGRTVAALSFASGLKVVYKPRDVGIENWYSDFLRWLNSSGLPIPLRTFKVLPKAGYGWVEFIPHVRCSNKQAIAQYYRNAGAVLCVLHLLRASDCHFQNLIACGPSPVLIDAEMLFQPRLPGESEFISVRRTGMIPHWNRDPAPHGYDLSALGCVAPKATPFYVPTSTAEGVRLLPAVLRPEANVPFPIRDTVEPEAYVPDMISGFREVYRFGASHRGELLTQLENVVNTRVRYTLRDTLEYYQALTETLRSGVTAEAVLGPLPQARAGLSTLRPDETSSLEQLDIPRFTLSSASRDLGGVKNCLAASGYELAAQGIEGLSEKDLQQQEAFIQLAWSLFRVSRSLS